MIYILTCAHKPSLCVCVLKTQLQCFFKSSEHDSTKYFVVPVHPKLWLNDLHLPQVIFLYFHKKIYCYKILTSPFQQLLGKRKKIKNGMPKKPNIQNKNSSNDQISICDSIGQGIVMMPKHAFPYRKFSAHFHFGDPMEI